MLRVEHLYISILMQYLLKKLKPIGKETIHKAFAGDNIRVFDNSVELFKQINNQTKRGGLV